MKIILNGTPTETEAKTLEALLAETGHGGRVATAVNESFVPAALRGRQALSQAWRSETTRGPAFSRLGAFQSAPRRGF